MGRLAARVPLRVRRRIVSTLPEPVWQRMRVYVHGRSVPQIRLRQLRTLTATASLKPVTGVYPIMRNGSLLLAQPVTHFRATAVLARNLAHVVDALSAAGIPHAVVEAEPGARRRVMVPASQRGRALAVLVSSCSGSATYLVEVQGRRIGRPMLLRRGVRRVRDNTAVVRIFDVLCSPSADFLSADDLGCDLEFWPETRSDAVPLDRRDAVPIGSLIAPRPNRWIDVIEPPQRRMIERVVDGTARLTLAAVRREHIFAVTEPIDVVYTWVDGSDPAWLARKASALRDNFVGIQDHHPTADNVSRFLSHDELRYSLRSLEMYADWVRHVYIVTAGQVPPWLRTDHEQLHLIDHRDLFGTRGRLPTFNSHAIESQLHHIDGLAEHYLYFNDDVFIGRPVSPSLFFHGNGLGKFFLSAAKLDLGPPSKTDMPVMSAAKNNRALLEDHFGRQVTNKFKHVPHPQRRSVLNDMEQEFAEDFQRTASSQLRHWSDISIPSSLQHYYSYVTGRSVPGEIRYMYLDIAHPKAAYRLEKLLEKRDYDAFCLNDHSADGIDPGELSELITKFLTAFYPLPSSFEKSVHNCD